MAPDRRAALELLRRAAIASLAGILTGIVVGGLLGRAAMRVSGFLAGPEMVGVRTEAGNRVGDITFEGTLGLILFVGVASGLVGGGLYALLEPVLRRLRPWHGVAYGVGLLLVAGTATLDPINFDFKRFGPAALNVAMFAALFVVFGVLIAWLFEKLLAVAARGGAARWAVEVPAWLSLPLAAVAAVLLAINVFPADTGESLIFLAGVGGSLFAYWRGLPARFSYAALALPLVVGTVRLSEALRALLA